MAKAPGLVIKSAKAQPEPIAVLDNTVAEARVIAPESGVPIQSFCMGIATVDPGVKGTVHNHNIEEAFYFIQGSGYYDIQDEDGVWQKLEFEPGDWIYISPNVKHRMNNSHGTEQVRFVYTCGHMLETVRNEWQGIFPDEDPS